MFGIIFSFQIITWILDYVILNHYLLLENKGRNLELLDERKHNITHKCALNIYHYFSIIYESELETCHLKLLEQGIPIKI